jgi:hypothetical protein
MATRFFIGALCAVLVTGIAVTNGLADEPVFVKWLLMDDPGDRAIAGYWERFEAGDLDAAGMIDLGTMLFYRGYPKDAVRVFEAVLDEDGDHAEAWFRIGLVEHHGGNLREARRAYRKCLGEFKGHGWCNFYLGLLEEQAGNAVKAMEYFQKAFRYAPVLSDPTVNPEMTSSDIAYGARLQMMQQEAFSNNLPMPFIGPDDVRDARRKAPRRGSEAPKEATGDTAAAAPEAASSDTSGSAAAVGAAVVTTAPTVEQGRRDRGSRSRGESEPKPLREQPARTPSTAPRNTSDLPYGLPEIPQVSSEASLRTWWQELRDTFA